MVVAAWTPSAQAMEGWRKKVPLAQQIARDKNKLIAYAFVGTGWDEPSDAFIRKVLTTPEFFAATQDAFLLVEIPVALSPDDIDKETKKLMKKYKVINVPALVITNSKGKKITTMEYQIAPLSRSIREIERLGRRYAPKSK